MKDTTPVKRMLLVLGITAAAALVVGAVAISLGTSRTPRVMVGVVVARGTASVEATDQLGAQSSLVIARVVAPAPAWVVVSREGMGDMPAGLVGYARVPAGTSTDVRVTLDPRVRLTEYAIVTLNADAGVRGVFQFDQTRFDASPDKPYWAGGRIVRAKVWVRYNEMSNTFRE